MDSSWVRRLFDEAGVAMTFRVSPLELILCEAQMNIWHRVKHVMLRENNIERHRASNDAKVVQATYMKTNEITKLGETAL